MSVILLRATILDRVIAAHGEIVSRAIDAINSRSRSTCTYAEFLPAYMAAKIAEKRSRSKASYECFLMFDSLASKWRRELYDRPCYNCQACRSRRKAWPPQPPARTP